MKTLDKMFYKMENKMKKFLMESVKLFTDGGKQIVFGNLE